MKSEKLKNLANQVAFSTVEKEFECRAQARMWIRANQRGRRNLTDFQQVELALGDKADIELLAKANQVVRKGEQAGATLTNLSNLETVNARAEVAKLSGTSEGTVSKVEKILDSESPEVIQATRSGDVSIHLASKCLISVASIY